MARGTVFEDRNGNGRRDPDEPGLPGVRVSDGRTVVLTDEAGRWSLEIGDEAVIFVTKPSGWATPLSAENLPRFYYIHQPAGSPPDLTYPGVAPTGPLPESIDFPLQRKPEPSTFDVLLFADPQPQSEAELDYVRDDVITPLVGSTAAFGMTLGDILFDDLSLFPRSNALVGRIGIPWYNVPGNHELNFKAQDDRHALETFKRFFGPPYYSFEVGEALVVVLDNIQYLGTGASDPEDPRGNGGYIARFGQRQLDWLRKELNHVPKDKLVLLAMHAPLETYTSPNSIRSNTEDRKALFELLSGRPHLYSVAGHTHTTEHHDFDAEDGFAGPGSFHHHVLTTVSGSWWSGPPGARGIPDAVQRDGTPNGYHVLTVDGAETSVRFQAAGAPAEVQMRILFTVDPAGQASPRTTAVEILDGRIPIDRLPETEILVNLFDGGPKSTVAFRLDDGPYRDMVRVRRPDPFVQRLFSQHSDSIKSWVEPVPSSHLWSAALPEDLESGPTTVNVRAVDEFGHVHHADAILEIGG